MILDPATVIPYGLVLARMSGVGLVAPVYSAPTVPMPIRAMVVLLVTFLITPTLGIPLHTASAPGALAVALGSELLVGTGIGLAFRWSLEAGAMMGEMAGLQMGLGVATILDPMANDNTILTQVLFGMLYLVIFMALNGHHEILRSLHASYKAVPAGAEGLRLDDPRYIIEQTTAVFTLCLRMTASILIPLLMVTFAMALISRAFPQANVFIMSYAISLLLGLILLVSTTPAVHLAVADGIRGGAQDALKWLESL